MRIPSVASALLALLCMAGCDDIGQLTDNQSGMIPAIPKETIVASFSFENNTTDGSMFRNLGVAVDPKYQPGRVGSGFYLDRTSSSYLYCQDQEYYHIFEPTVEAWVRLDEHGYSNTILSENIQGADDDARGFLLDIMQGRARCAIGDESRVWKTVTGATSLELGKWYHVVGVYYGASLKVYVNGELDGIAKVSHLVISYRPRTGTGPAPSVLYVGIRHNAHATEPSYEADLTYPFHGIIDELRVYNRGLTDAEVKGLYLGSLSTN